MKGNLEHQPHAIQDAAIPLSLSCDQTSGNLDMRSRTLLAAQVRLNHVIVQEENPSLRDTVRQQLRQVDGVTSQLHITAAMRNHPSLSLVMR